MSIMLEVTNVLHAMGIPTKLKGFMYIREAVIMTMEDYSITEKITKTLYPVLAEKHNTTPSAVERSIRHAITVGWDRGNPEVLIEYFGYSIDAKAGKPTNTEFITLIADKMKQV